MTERPDNVDSETLTMQKKFNFRHKMASTKTLAKSVPELIEAIDKSPHYFEEITGECVPYFDIDHKFSSKKLLEEFLNSGIESRLEAAFKFVFTGGQCYFARSHGFKSAREELDPVPTKAGYHAFSYHVVVRGIGKYACGDDIREKFCDEIDCAISDLGLSCDRKPYKGVGKKQLLRTILSTKVHDNRPLDPTEVADTFEKFSKYLVQNVEGEELQTVPPKPKAAVEKHEGPKSDPDVVEWDELMNSGAYVKGGEKKKLSFDQVSGIVTNLSKKRFSDYEAWCKLLWAIARWQDENGQNEDDCINMLDTYCQQCENYGSKSDVVKKYAEAFKKAGRDSKVTIGTLIHWLKEDNFAAYCNVFGVGIMAKVEVKVIDRRDSYCWVDFVDDITTKVWENKQEVDDFISANITRVMALICKEKGFYIKKDSCKGGLFSYVEVIKGAINFNIRYVVEKVDKKTKDKSLKKGVEEVKFSDYLSSNEVLTRYADIGCYPDEKVNACPKNFYNIWEGYQAQVVTEVDESKIADLQYILRELWASGDEGLYKYILGWLRFVVANPAEMTKVALFLYSEEGSGKGTVVDFLMLYVLGLGISHSYTGIEEVIEKHNTNKKGKKLTYINEMGSTKDQFISNYDKIKPIITDPIIAENPKGRTIIQIDNITNVIMSTNHKNSLYLPSDNDRRYTCIEVSDKKCGAENKTWWAGVNQRIMNQDTGNHFYTWLLSLDPSELPNPRQVYKTKLREEIIEMSRDNVLVFADYIIEQENLKEDGEEKRVSVGAMDLFREYTAWCSAVNERAKSNRMFGAAISRILTKKRSNKGFVYTLPLNDSSCTSPTQ